VISTAGLRFTEAADGALAVSPDGLALLDAVLASDGQGVRYAIIRRIALDTGQVAVLGLKGQFTTTRFVVSPSSSSLQVYLVTGSPQATVFVLDASPQGPALLGQIALGGPATSVPLKDALAVSAAGNGSRLYITQDASSSDGVIVAHSRWLVDTQGMGVLASATDPTSAGALLANQAPQGKTFALINGRIAIGAPNLNSGWTAWLQTNDGSAIVGLIATAP
jgi:hypothetical protein